MNQKTISYEKALNFGFSSFFNNIFTYFILWIASMALIAMAWILLVLIWVPAIMFHGLWATLPNVLSFITVPFGIAFLIGSLCFAFVFLVEFYHYQMVRFALAIYESRPLPWKEFFVFSWSPFMPFCTTRFIRWFFIFLGCTLIFPAVYWACKYYFAGYSLLDSTNTSVSQDRVYSRKLTQGVKWQILGFIILLYVLSIIFSFTLMFAMPIIYLAQVHAYKQLKDQVDAEERGIQVEVSHRA